MTENTPPKTENSSSNREKSFKFAQIWNKTFIGLILLLGICILLSIFYFFKKEELPKNVSLDNNPTQVQSPQNNQPGRLPSPTPSPSPAPTIDFPSPPQVVTFKEYKNSLLKFSAQIPNNWQVLSETNDEVVFILPDQSRYSVQMYYVPNSDLNFINSKLLELNYISNLSSTNVFNHTALAFNISGIYKQGIALISNNRLYYVLGSQISSFEQFTIIN